MKSCTVASSRINTFRTVLQAVLVSIVLLILLGACLNLYAEYAPKTSLRQTCNTENILRKGELLHIAKLILEARGEVVVGTKIRHMLDRTLGDIEAFVSSRIERSGKTFATQDQQPLEVCPETYIGLTHGGQAKGGSDSGGSSDPALDEHGWEFSKCSNAQPLENLVSLVFNGLQHSKDDLLTLLIQIRKQYPKLKIFLAAKHDVGKQNNVHVLRDKFENDGDSWKTLISKVDTKYTVILRDVYRFTNYTRIERLVSVASRHDIPIVGGSSVGINGHWWENCYQIYMKLYELRYVHGYYLSEDSCLYCEHMTGPFLGRTAYLKEFITDVKKVDNFLFENMFLNAKKKGRVSMVCPDTMFHVDRIVVEKGLNKQYWLPLARSQTLTKISAFEKVFEFTCSEVSIRCPMRRKGMAEAPCCLKQLSRCVEKINQLGNDRHVVLELECGTLLGVLKMNAVLPWELDADMYCHTDNTSEISKWKNEIGPLGCEILLPKRTMKASKWNSDFTSHTIMSSVLYVRRTGYNTTRVLFGDTWSQSGPSPGLMGRNKYRSEIYRHVPHPTQGGTYEFVKGSFPPCPEPGHHACLDQFYADGNLYYQMYTKH